MYISVEQWKNMMNRFNIKNKRCTAFFSKVEQEVGVTVIHHDFTYLSLQNLPSFISVCLHIWPNLNLKEKNSNNKHNKQNEPKKTVNLPTVLNCFFFPIFILFSFLILLNFCGKNCYNFFNSLCRGVAWPFIGTAGRFSRLLSHVTLQQQQCEMI